MNEEQIQMLDGKNKILLFRRMKDQGASAAKLIFQTEHTFEYERELDAIVTKDGTVVKVGELETEVDIEAIAAKNDPVGSMLQSAMINGERLEIWEVNVDEDLADDGKYPAVYAQGYLSSWAPTASAEDESEISSTFIVDLKPQFGFATLTAEQQEEVQYAFKDTVADDEDESNGDVEDENTED